MSQTFYLKRSESVRGPFSLQKLQGLLNNRKLKPGDLVSIYAEGPWKQVREVHRDIREGIPLVFDTKAADDGDESTEPEFDFDSIAELEGESESLGKGDVEPCFACGEPVVETTEQCPHCGEPHLKLKQDALNSSLQRHFVADTSSGSTFGGGQQFGAANEIVMHTILAILCSGLSGVLCGCFGFIPMLWFAFRNHQRGEIEIGVIYMVGAAVSFFLGPWLWYVLFGISILANG
tara:strand:+ start:44 stop:745 length:702 start_codon:yes stop_codon:yes gene_type:complete